MRTIISLCLLSILLLWSSSVPVTAQTSDGTLTQGIEAFRTGNIPAATAAFEKALGKADTRPLANFWLGLMHYAQGERAVAKQEFSLAYEAVEGEQVDSRKPGIIRLDFPSTLEAKIVQRNGWQIHPIGTAQSHHSLELQAGNHYSVLVTPNQQRQKIRAIRWAGAALLLTWLLAR